MCVCVCRTGVLFCLLFWAASMTKCPCAKNSNGVKCVQIVCTRESVCVFVCSLLSRKIQELHKVSVSAEECTHKELLCLLYLVQMNATCTLNNLP